MRNTKKAEYWINRLSLTPHPEGGYFREVHRSSEVLPREGLPPRFAGPRNFVTSIYYLLEGEDFSSFHRIQSDELWHFYAGPSSLEVHILAEGGDLEKLLIGPDPDLGESFIGVVPARNWFAARCTDTSGFALAGCTVAPGFDFQDFEMADRDTLLKEFPNHAGVITALTRQ